MYDYTLNLQTKQRIEDMRRETERRHWLRDALKNLQAEREARKNETQRQRAA